MAEKKRFCYGDLVEVRSKGWFGDEEPRRAVVREVTRKGEDIALWVEKWGQCAWFSRDSLTLIEQGREDIMDAWEEEINNRVKLHRSKDWIFSDECMPSENGQCNGTAISALAVDLGITNMWGAHGEGFVYLQNYTLVNALAEPFIRTNDRAGWEEYAKKLREGADGLVRASKATSSLS